MNVTDMLRQLETLLSYQEQLHQEHQCQRYRIDIGYHYTHGQCLGTIAEHGLLSRKELNEHDSVPYYHHGARLGDGIYTADNPLVYHGFGGATDGLFVARLKGRVCGENDNNSQDEANTVIARRHDDSDPNTQVVMLRSPSQAAVLSCFPSSLVDREDDHSMGNAMIRRYHCGLQEILDHVVNCDLEGVDSLPTQVPLVLPSHMQWVQPLQQQPSMFLSFAAAAIASSSTRSSADKARSESRISTFKESKLLLFVKYTAPEELTLHHGLARHIKTLESPADDSKQDECSICFEHLHCAADSVPVALRKCGHRFHMHCLQQAVARQSCCPLCRHRVQRTPQGKMPSGTMTVREDHSIRLAGQPLLGALVLTYDISADLQKSYHPQPGQANDSTLRVAYLPISAWPEICRLAFAFQHGLTFDIGTSLTTGKTNQVTWASIPHKTELDHGAVHGFPEEHYLVRLNKTLTGLSVPLASALRVRKGRVKKTKSCRQCEKAETDR